MPHKFQWSLYLTLASKLSSLALTEQTLNTSELMSNNSIKEAYYRAAISRAYYAAFCSARNYLRDTLNLRIPLENTHNFVINEFKERWDIKNSRTISNTLYTLRKDRNNADYDDNPIRNVDSTATRVMRDSQKIVELINQL